MDKLDRFLARLASVIAIIIAIWYWLASKTSLHLGQSLICRYTIAWIGALLLILVFYLLLTRAILKHLILLQKHHTHIADEQYAAQVTTQPNYVTQYYSTLFEALLVVSIIAVTIAAFAASGATCALQHYL